MSLMPPLPSYQDTFRLLPADADKLAHFLAYFLLMSWFAQIYHLPIQRLQWAGSFILLGLVLEILQGFTGVRHPSWLDALANSLGIMVAWFLTKKQWAYLLINFERKYCYKTE